MQQLLDLITNHPQRTFWILLVFAVLVLFALIAIIKIPWTIRRSIKKLTQTLVRLELDEPVASLDAFIRHGETHWGKGCKEECCKECSHGGYDQPKHWVDSKYLDKLSWEERGAWTKDYWSDKKESSENFAEWIASSREFWEHKETWKEKTWKEKAPVKKATKIVKKTATKK